MMRPARFVRQTRIVALLVAGTLLLTESGCWSEPEPFRSKDPDKARMLKKTQDPSRPPGLPKGGSRFRR
jgi:hypothetical protein